MRIVLFITIIVLIGLFVLPIALGAGQKVRERFQGIWNGGHDPKKVKELRKSRNG